MDSASDSEDRSASGPSSSKGKEKQNEACTNCRSVKRRCLNAGDHTPCTRCVKQNLECSYHQLKRGRKAGTTVGGGSGASARPRKRRTTEPIARTEKNTGAASAGSADTMVQVGEGKGGEGADWLASYLQAEASSSSVSSSSVPLQPAAFPVQLPSTSLAYPPPSSQPPPHLNLDRRARPPPPTHDRSHLPSPFQPTLRTSAASPNDASPAVSASSPGSAATPQAVPATGGFSLRKLLGENHGAAKAEGDEGENPPRQSLADAFQPEEERRAGEGASRGRAEKVKELEDIVSAGIINEEMVEPLFNFYFAQLNAFTSLLDPALHTISFCRSRSPLLFTAILTVATKVHLPPLFAPAYKYSKYLMGQAFESGQNDLELVQAIATLVFYQDATEEAGARRLAFAIRCAVELGLHKKGKRPLPEGEMEKRMVLNRERTVVADLTVTDHRTSTQRGLPRMIENQYRYDAVPWVLEHGADFCPQEAGLMPLIELGRILDVFAVLTSQDGVPSMELLKCLEADVTAWKGKWSGKASIPLQPAQSSLVRFYSEVLEFNLLELGLFVAIQRTAHPEILDSFGFNARTSVAVSLRNCITASIRVLDTMENELGYMVYSFDSMWVGTASAAIWIITNLSVMEPRDRKLSLDAISRLQLACARCATNSQSMAAYTDRLLQHLLRKAAKILLPPPQFLPPPVAVDTTPASAAAPPPTAAAPPPYVTASLSAPTWSTDIFGSTTTGWGTPSSFLSAPVAPTTVGEGGTGILGGSAEGYAGAGRVQTPMLWHGIGGGGEEVGGEQQDPMAFLSSFIPPAQSFGEELPFPAADNALWESLFPLFSGDSVAPS